MKTGAEGPFNQWRGLQDNYPKRDTKRKNKVSVGEQLPGLQET